MSTKSNRSAGTQHTQKGVIQGNSLVDPKTGNPVNVVLGPDGKYRLCVDANVTANISGVDVALDGIGPDGDNVYLVDNVTGYKLKINPDGTLDVNVTIDSATGDNIAIKDSQGNELNVNPDGSINVVLQAGSAASSPTIFNVNVPTANTEVSQALPPDTKKFIIKVRDSAAKMQLAFTAGQSNTNYISVSRGVVFSEEGISIAAGTVYFQLDKPSCVVEILTWN